jgi:hypothetical protein
MLTAISIKLWWSILPSFIDITGNINRHSFIDIPRSIDHHSFIDIAVIIDRHGFIDIAGSSDGQYLQRYQ